MPIAAGGLPVVDSRKASTLLVSWASAHYRRNRLHPSERPGPRSRLARRWRHRLFALTTAPGRRAMFHVEKELAVPLEDQTRTISENDLRDMSAFTAALPFAISWLQKTLRESCSPSQTWGAIPNDAPHLGLRPSGSPPRCQQAPPGMVFGDQVFRPARARAAHPPVTWRQLIVV